MRLLGRSAFAAIVAFAIACCTTGIPVREETAAAKDIAGAATITEANDGAEISLAPGQTLVVSLESNPTTGYSWSVSEIDSQLLREAAKSMEHPAKKKSGPPLVGAPGRESFSFTAESPGTTTLALIYRRPWEKKKAPARTFSVEVTVR